MYDIAFSFLADDEPPARALSEKLAGRATTFVYSERQKDLAGKDGVETFSAVFRRQARLVVVLYRDGWGKTKWTRIEETAIKERYLDEGMSFLLVVAMKPRPTLPAWLPRTRLYFNLAEFGLDGAVAAIVARFQEAGGEPRDESPSELAARLAEAKRRRDTDVAWLHSFEGARGAYEEFRRIGEYWRTEAATIPGFDVRVHDRTTYVRSDGGSIAASWSPGFANTTEHGVLAVQEWDGRIAARDLGEYFDFEAKPTRHWRFAFDVDEAGTRGWREMEGRDRFYTSEALAKMLLTQLVNRSLGA